jgi:hypothetical protein
LEEKFGRKDRNARRKTPRTKEEVTKKKVRTHFQEKNRKESRKIKLRLFKEISRVKRAQEIRVGRSLKAIAGAVECKGIGQYILVLQSKKVNAPSGNEVKNQKNKCHLYGKQGHYSKNCPEKKYNNMPHQHELFCRACRRLPCVHAGGG